MQNIDITMQKALKDDTIFNKINKEFLSLDSDDVRSNNQSLSKILDKLIEVMKRENLLFSKIFQRIIWAGSYYKKTRIEEPKEYDINLVIDLCIKKKNLQFIPDCPGYTKIRTKVSPSDINLDKKTRKELLSFIDEDSYLNQEKIRKWMERILSKVACATSGNDRYIKLDTYEITRKKSGPAFTLSVPFLNGEIDIDLVPVLAFSISDPPPGYSEKLFSISKNPQKYNNKCWSVVPKPLSNNKGEFPDKQHRYWRLCFYEVEKDILSDKIYERAKPIIRHLKKLRDTQNWKNIASYYIETLCLHHLKILENANKTSSTFLFFKMLQKLYDAFHEGCIKYYWNDKLNLLEKMDRNEIKNIENRLSNIIKKIEKTVNNNKFVIAEFILNKNDCDKLKTILNTTTRGATADQDQMQTEPSKEWGCMIA